ncbi:hypothetical protein D3C87_1792570 [compost metagenome]
MQVAPHFLYTFAAQLKQGIQPLSTLFSSKLGAERFHSHDDGSICMTDSIVKLFRQPVSLFCKRNTLDLGHILLKHRVLLADRFILPMIDGQ